MKKLLLLTLLFMFILRIGLTPASAQEQTKSIPVLLDGLPIKFDVQPVIQNERTLVPFRAIAEALNVTVIWDGTTQSVIASNDTANIKLYINNKTAYRNEVPIKLDVPPLIINDRTFIPLRFFSEAFSCSVLWDDTYGVKITSPRQSMSVIGFYALGDTETSSWKNLFGKNYPEADKGNTDLVSEIAAGWYSMDGQGNLLTKSRTGWQRPDGWNDVIKSVKEFGLKTEMVIHVADGDGTIVTLLTNENAVNKAISDIVIEAKNYSGVNLDFEGLGLQSNGNQSTIERDAFTDFVRLLSEQLKAANLGLTLTLHAPNSAYKGYDYHALGQLADRIIIMAYDYGAKPEPVNLVTQAVEMAKAVVPSQKLILGISIPSENPESVITKAGIAKRYNLGGIALWRLGLVTNETWDAFRTTIQPR
jgi:hypothetical protein